MSITNRLRYTAERYGLAAPKVATLMMEAADTITELRKENQSIGLVAYELGRKSMAGENEKLRKQSARAWRLFTKHGAVHENDLPEVDAVRDGLRELGAELD